MHLVARSMLVVAFALCCGSTASSHGQAQVITLHSKWGADKTMHDYTGWIYPHTFFIVPMAPDAVRAADMLADALESLSQTVPSAKALRINGQWVANHLYEPPKNCAESLTGSRLEKALAIAFASPFQHTDDYPSESVTVDFGDGQAIEASSNSQNPLMLPWTVTRHIAGTNNKPEVTFNRTIGDMLAKLFKYDVNLDRLTGGDSPFNASSEEVCKAGSQ
ncbi:MAG: hypothetical protein NVSMB31_03390 [Vulcanimicrobiaceae bacterium]